MSEGLYRYTPCFCEENVWHLCQEPALGAFEKEVAFISNPQRACLLWQQKASPTPQEPACWDYHVILLVRQEGWMVWDLDSRLGLPLPAKGYFEETFRAGWPAAPPLFRLLGSQEFVARFDSDRSHMRTAGGGWQAPPPPWPPIRSADGYPLQTLIDMKRQKPGQVLTLNQVPSRY